MSFLLRSVFFFVLLLYLFYLLPDRHSSNFALQPGQGETAFRVQFCYSQWVWSSNCQKSRVDPESRGSLGRAGTAIPGEASPPASAPGTLICASKRKALLEMLTFCRMSQAHPRSSKTGFWASFRRDLSLADHSWQHTLVQFLEGKTNFLNKAPLACQRTSSCFSQIPVMLQSSAFFFFFLNWQNR